MKCVMNSFLFSKYKPDKAEKSPFESMLDLFLKMLEYTSGEVDEAIEWLRQLVDNYNLGGSDYDVDDFVEDLKKEGYLDETMATGKFKMTPKTEQTIRKNALDEIFGKLKKSATGNHSSFVPGKGDEPNADTRPYRFGDSLEQIDFTNSIKNAQINHGIESFQMGQDDLEIRETDYKAQTSTVLMIDISHSMILYGEDRITPAKKTAMALSELILTKYPKDTLDIIVFGNDAWEIKVKDIPYLKVGPYHTNTVAGLELAMNILRHRKNPNKQIFMITDGKPTCLKIGKRYYKNAFGLDPKILNRTLNLAAQCRKLKIPITTFMVTADPWLQKFVKEFTATNNGKAFFSSLDNLGEFVFYDFERNKRKYMR